MIRIAAALDNRPYVFFVKAPNEQEIFSKCFKPNTTPDIVPRFRMTVRYEKSIESIFVQNKWATRFVSFLQIIYKQVCPMARNKFDTGHKTLW